VVIKFRSKEIPGTHGAAVFPPPELHVVRTYFWSMRGQTEIVGDTGGREVTVDLWLHDGFKKREDIAKKLKALDAMVGAHGVLEVDLGAQPKTASGSSASASSKEKETLRYCTFGGFDRSSIGQGPVPVFDYAGTVDGGWFAAGMLRFYQLRTD